MTPGPGAGGVELTARAGEAGTPRVSVEGELDVAAAGDLARLLEGLEAAGTPARALDLRQVGHLDSVALRAIVEADRRARRQGRRLVVIAPPARAGRADPRALAGRPLGGPGGRDRRLSRSGRGGRGLDAALGVEERLARLARVACTRP